MSLRNLTIIKNCINLIKKENPNFELPKEYNDPKTLKLINDGDTTGVFQLEKEGMKQTLRHMGVQSFEDICNVLALYRPGPMDMIDTFVARKKKIEPVVYLHDDLKPILESTYGIIIFQEQIILIACKIAGLSLGDADILRRAVSKKKRDILEKEQAKFISSAINNGYSEEIATKIYDDIIKFANYGFVKSHSVAYSVIAYYTAFLKCNYPNYYYSVLLNSVIGTESVNEYCLELFRKNIKVLVPNINYSQDTFTLYNNTIIMPLSQIDGIGSNYCDTLLNIRGNNLFSSFDDFVKRVHDKIPTSLIENIILSGALDCFNITKKDMITNLNTIINRSKYSFITDTVSLDYSNEEFSYGYLLTKEKEILGVNIRYNFLFQYEGLYRKKIALHIRELSEGIKTIIGVVKRIKEITTKNDKKMFFVTVSDDLDSISLTVFPNMYQSFLEVKEGMVLLIKGKVEKRNNELQIVLEAFKQI